MHERNTARRNSVTRGYQIYDCENDDPYDIYEMPVKSGEFQVDCIVSPECAFDIRIQQERKP